MNITQNYTYKLDINKQHVHILIKTGHIVKYVQFLYMLTAAPPTKQLHAAVHRESSLAKIENLSKTIEEIYDSEGEPIN